MAADWIPMRVDLIEDPAVISIAMATGLDEFAVVGRLQCLWSWANTHTKNGHAHVTLEWIDAKMRSQNFSKAMISAGWLTSKGDKVLFPRFDRWNSQSAKRRVLAARRKRRERTRQQRDIQRDTLATREEKRREHKEPPTPFESKAAENAAEVAQRFFFFQRGKKEDEPLVAELVEEMVRVGYSLKAIAAEVDRAKRDRGERFFKLKDRLEKQRPSGVEAPDMSKSGLADRAREEAARIARAVE